MPKSMLSALVMLGLACGQSTSVMAEAGTDSDAKRAGALFSLAFAGRCADDAFSPETLASTETETFTYRNSSDEAAQTPYQATLYTFFCDRFHNSGSAAFILKDKDGHFHVVTFATPISAFKAAPGEDVGLVVAGLEGFSTTDTLLNGEFNPETLTVSSGTYEMGREYFATYAFRDGAFVFAGDQTYQIRNGALVLDPREVEDEP